MEQSKKKLSGCAFRKKAMEKKKTNERTAAFFHNWLDDKQHTGNNLLLISKYHFIRKGNLFYTLSASWA